MSFQPGSSGDEVASVIFGGNTSAHADDTTPMFETALLSEGHCIWSAEKCIHLYSPRR